MPLNVIVMLAMTVCIAIGFYAGWICGADRSESRALTETDMWRNATERKTA